MTKRLSSRQSNRKGSSVVGHMILTGIAAVCMHSTAVTAAVL